MSLGTAFENLSRGLGMAYFPAISLSFKESVAFNFGSRPLRYHFGKMAVGGLASRMRSSLPQDHCRLVAGPGCCKKCISCSLGWWVHGQ